MSRHIPDEDIAWAVRLAMEVRRRVKEQQKRIGRSEFGKTEFSFAVDKRRNHPRPEPAGPGHDGHPQHPAAGGPH